MTGRLPCACGAAPQRPTLPFPSGEQIHQQESHDPSLAGDRGNEGWLAMSCGTALAIKRLVEAVTLLPPLQHRQLHFGSAGRVYSGGSRRP